MKKLAMLFILLFACTIISYAQPTVDGDLSDANYTTLATKLNSNAGFGSAIDVSKIVYYPDVTNSVLYIGVVGKLDVTSNNEIAVWLNVTGTGSPTGIAAGNSLGVNNGSAGYIGDNTNPNYKADFEVDYMFGFNPGGTPSTPNTSNVYFDAGKLVGTAKDYYQGSCNQTGTSATNSNENGTVFGQNTITFAFNNDGGTNHGLEMAIPFAQIGATSSMSIEVFACVVSFTAYFSNVSVPGNMGSGNPGFNVDFTGASTGPFHTNTSPLPVELSTFTAAVANSAVELNWKTATEVNNYGFEVQRAVSGKQSESLNWEKIGFVNGAGNSSSPKQYSFTDKGITFGSYSYRLKQIDVDGQYKYSSVVNVSAGQLPNGFVLNQNYPNPFNPSTQIQFGFNDNTRATLTVYNVLGQKVASLFDGVAQAGQLYNITFNGDNFASGIYYYKLQSDNHTQIKKMLLMK